jgi:hypothetical protein
MELTEMQLGNSRTAKEKFFDVLLGGNEPMPCFNCGVRDDSVRYSNLLMEWVCDGDWFAYMNGYEHVD